MEITEKIRQTANIIDIASQYTTLKRRGKKHIGLCPFHPEKNPSFTVDEEKQLFHCFGCGAGGDVFTLVIEKESLDFPEAVKFLAEKYRIPLPHRKKMSSQQRKLEEELYSVTEKALSFFKKNLYNTSEGKKALQYLQKRGFSEDVIQTLKIGYALNSWDSLLSAFRAKGVSPDLLEKAGLALKRQNQEGCYDRFRGRIIFPILSVTGKPVAFGGRSLFDADPKYLNSPDTPIYTKGDLLYGLNFSREAIREKDEMILVEGYTDYLSLFQAGFTNCAASLGTSLTPNQVALAKRFASRIIISYDGDNPGKKAAARAFSICLKKGVEAKILPLPTNFDPDSFIQKFGSEEFKNLIQKSTPGFKFIIDFQFQGGKFRSPEEKARAVKEIVPLIENSEDPVIRSEYLKQASAYLSLDEDTLRVLAHRGSNEKQREQKAPFLPAEKRLLQILYEEKEIRPHILAETAKEDFRGLNSEPIYDYFLECNSHNKDFQLHELKKRITPSLFTSFSAILQENAHPSTLEEAYDNLSTLKQNSLEKIFKELKFQITDLEKNGEKEKILPLLTRRMDIARQLSDLSQRSPEDLRNNKRGSFSQDKE